MTGPGILLAIMAVGIGLAVIASRQPSVVNFPVFDGTGWTWDQSLGQLFYAGRLIANGYSGSGLGKNNPQMEAVPDGGPIPQGTYLIKPPVDDPHMGPFALELQPTGGQDMYGRSGFFMHGDSIEHPGQASEGCIIVSRDIRQLVWQSGDTRLQVLA